MVVPFFNLKDQAGLRTQELGLNNTGTPDREIGGVPLLIGGPGQKMEKTAASDFDPEVISPSIPRILAL